MRFLFFLLFPYALFSQITPIYKIQGTEDLSPFADKKITTTGVVTGVFNAPDQLNGFFIQHENGDKDEKTSDGIFVISSFRVKIGDLLQVNGMVKEIYGMTSISDVKEVKIVKQKIKVISKKISLPLASETEWEQYEGMLIEIDQQLTVLENHNIVKYGELTLSAMGRLRVPTNFIDPNDVPANGTNSSGNSNIAAIHHQGGLHSRSTVYLNDGSSKKNPKPVPYLHPKIGNVRVGSTIEKLVGVVHFANRIFSIHPVEAVKIKFVSRPPVPIFKKTDLRIATFNTQNYFNGKIGNDFNGSRGANNYESFSRQREKIIAALTEVDADIVALMEIENDGGDEHSAIADLVMTLNDTVEPAKCYAYIKDPQGNYGNSGNDAIKAGLIYRPSKVTPVGQARAHKNSIHSRPPLFQTFVAKNCSETFSVIAVHFKSKICDGAKGKNQDQNDGQSCFNEKRKQQSMALLKFIEEMQEQSGEEKILVIGDLNSYHEEDPLDILREGGLQQINAGSHTYIYHGESGVLDHVFATPEFIPKVADAKIWHINADEPEFLNYENSIYFKPDPFRSSDHDPIIIGIKF